MLGVLFALISTASFSLNSVMVRRGVASASASAGAFVTVLIGVPMFGARSTFPTTFLIRTAPPRRINRSSRL